MFFVTLAESNWLGLVAVITRLTGQNLLILLCTKNSYKLKAPLNHWLMLRLTVFFHNV